MPWVLATDDQPHITRLIQLTLRKAGIDIVTCSDGEAAWLVLESGSLPDLIITDFQMPRLDGLGLCRRIRDTPELGDIPIILLTGKGFELSSESVCRQLGIREVLVKPFSPRRLRQLVCEILDLPQQHSPEETVSTF